MRQVYALSLTGRASGVLQESKAVRVRRFTVPSLGGSHFLENRSRLRIGHDLVDLAFRIQRIKRDKLRARRENTEHGDACFDRVRQKRRDALAPQFVRNSAD